MRIKIRQGLLKMSETVRPDTFTKWVLGVCSVLFVSILMGIGATLWNINTSLVKVVGSLGVLDTRVEVLELDKNKGRRYTYEDAQQDRQDLIVRVTRLENTVYGFNPQYTEESGPQ